MAGDAVNAAGELTMNLRLAMSGDFTGRGELRLPLLTEDAIAALPAWNERLPAVYRQARQT